MIYGYKEMYPSRDLPYMADNIQSDRYDGQEKIIAFLLNGDELFAKQGHDRDVFTGKRLDMDTVIMEKGQFQWPSILAYYVEKYNLRLSPDFESYILSH